MPAYLGVFRIAGTPFRLSPRFLLTLLAVSGAAAVFFSLAVVGGERIWLVAVSGFVLGTVVLLSVARKPARGLTLLVLSLPLVSVGVVEVGWSVRPVQVIVVLVAMALLLSRRFDWTAVPLRRWMAVYVASLVFSALWGLFHEATGGVSLVEAVSLRASVVRPLVQLVTIILGLAVLPVTLTLVRDERHLTRAVKTLLSITALVALYGVYQPLAVAFGWPLTDITQAFSLGHSAVTNYGATRFYSAIVGSFAPRSTFAESLHFGAYLAGILPLCLACWLGRKSLPRNWRNWPWASLSLLLSTVLLLTLSRSSWVVALLGVIIVLIAARGLKAWILGTFFVLSLYLAFFAFTRLSIFDSSLSPVALIAERLSVEQLAVDPRWTYQDILFRTALVHPILGVGLGGFALIGAARLGMDTIVSAHGVWQSHWVEGGVVGLLTLLLFVGAIARRLVRAWPYARRSPWYHPLLGLCAGIIAMSAQYLTFGDRFAPYFWFLVAIALCVARLACSSQQKFS